MEDEAFFLWVVYRVEPMPTTTKDGKDLFQHMPVIRKVALKKPEGRGALRDFIYKRVQVDFDGLVEQAAFVVVMHTKIEDGGAISVEKFCFPGIVKTLAEAEALKLRAEVGEFRSLMEKGQKLHEVTIAPAFISEY